MIGGFSQKEIEQEHRDLVNANLAGINSKLAVNATAWTVDAVFSQVVAGKNYFFHLTDNNGAQYSVCIYVPLPHTGAPAEVASGYPGHVPATNPNQ